MMLSLIIITVRIRDDTTVNFAIITPNTATGPEEPSSGNYYWTQLGDIDGEAVTDYSGYSVSLSSDGTIVAIGADFNNNGKGHVRVYQYSLLLGHN